MARYVSSIDQSLEAKQKLWQEEHDLYVAQRARELHEAWLASMHAQFRADASAEYEAQRPRWTTEREAEIYFRATNRPKDSTRRDNFKLRPEAKGLTGEAFEEALAASYEAEVKAYVESVASARREVPSDA